VCSLAGRYDNPISTRFLAPIDCLKTLAKVCVFGRYCVQNMNWTQQYVVKITWASWGLWKQIFGCGLERYPVPCLYHPLQPGGWNRTQQITLLFMQVFVWYIPSSKKLCIDNVYSKIMSTPTKCVRTLKSFLCWLSPISNNFCFDSANANKIRSRNCYNYSYTIDFVCSHIIPALTPV
jgi:hypothetical protein